MSKKKASETTNEPQAPVIPATLLVPALEQVSVILIGCGGTGSWLAPAIARLARVADRKVEITFVDPDHVEAGNICRQNFCDAEIGKNKATALAERYGQAWGLDITSSERRFDAAELGRSWDRLSFLIGCVDNAAARKSIHKALSFNTRHHVDPDRANLVWWLDSGNAELNGQVLLGCADKPDALLDSFPAPKTCIALPSPALQHPELLRAKPEETNKAAGMTCAELMAANAQSLIVNQRIAAEAADYLARLLLRRPLKRFATYVDLDTGTARGVPITPETVGRAAGIKITPYPRLEGKARTR
jgi:PRTRC genetic system ThiF family protein